MSKRNKRTKASGKALNESMPTMREQLEKIQSFILDLLASDNDDVREANIELITDAVSTLQSYRPKPESMSWEDDERLKSYWQVALFETWDAVPVEFRGDVTKQRTLHEKITIMANRIKELEAKVFQFESKKDE